MCSHWTGDHQCFKSNLKTQNTVSKDQKHIWYYTITEKQIVNNDKQVAPNDLFSILFKIKHLIFLFRDYESYIELAICLVVYI